MDRASPYFDETKVFLAKVFLDGVQTLDAVEIDEEGGWVTRLARDAAGNIRVENNEAVRETVHGAVHIELPGEREGA